MNDEKILGQNPKKLPQYKGKLTAEEVAAGINAARQNAKRLFHSAEILFANGDYATSVSLAILAIEESGKSSILRGIAVTSISQMSFFRGVSIDSSIKILPAANKES